MTVQAICEIQYALVVQYWIPDLYPVDNPILILICWILMYPLGIAIQRLIDSHM